MLSIFPSSRLERSKISIKDRTLERKASLTVAITLESVSHNSQWVHLTIKRVLIKRMYVELEKQMSKLKNDYCYL